MVTIPANDTAQTLLSSTAMLQILFARLNQDIRERLFQGLSLEDALKEIMAWAEDTPEGDGLAHFLNLERYLKNDQLDEALKTCLEFRQAWPDADFVASFMEGHILTLLRRYDETFDAFRVAAKELQPLSTIAYKIKQDIYNMWILVGMYQALEGLAYNNTRAFEEGGLKCVDILGKAEADGMGQVVEDIVARVKAGLKKKKEIKAFEELELFINLMRIKDPFEGWWAIGKALSERWPKGHSLANAVREMRR